MATDHTKTQNLLSAYLCAIIRTLPIYCYPIIATILLCDIVAVNDAVAEVGPTRSVGNTLVFSPNKPVAMPSSYPAHFPPNIPVTLPENTSVQMLPNSPVILPENKSVQLPPNIPVTLPPNTPIQVPPSNPIALPKNDPVNIPPSAATTPPKDATQVQYGKNLDSGKVQRFFPEKHFPVFKAIQPILDRLEQ